MSRRLPEYGAWSETCDTLHAHVQVLGKLAATLARPEPRFQHGALRLTQRGWETAPLPVRGGSGALVVGIDLRSHEAFVEQSSGTDTRIALSPDRAVADVTAELLAAVRAVAGEVDFDPSPAEVWWDTPLDEDRDHRRYDPDAVDAYFQTATQVAQALNALRAGYSGLCTPVNAWWGSFDLALSLFCASSVDGATAAAVTGPPDAREVALGWWPGDPKHPTAALYAYVKPSSGPPADSESKIALEPPQAHWDDKLGEFLLEWADVQAAGNPQQTIISFGKSVFAYAGRTVGWDPAAVLEGE